MAAGLIDVVPKTASHCIVSEHIRLSFHHNNNDNQLFTFWFVFDA